MAEAGLTAISLYICDVFGVSFRGCFMAEAGLAAHGLVYPL